MTQRQFILGTLSAFIAVSLSAARPASAQSARRDTIPHAIQKPVARKASVDSLVECSPVAAPTTRKPVARRTRAVTPAARKSAPRKSAVKATPKKVAPKPAPRKLAARTPGTVVHRARRVRSKPAVAAHTTTVVMCRPVAPLAPLAMGTPTEQSVIPVPRLAKAVPPAAAIEDGPPLFVSTAPGMLAMTTGGGRSWLPFSVIPALFVPFIHSGGTHHGSMMPIDTMPGPPVIPPPTTVPEPSTVAMLASGLFCVAAISKRKRKPR